MKYYKKEDQGLIQEIKNLDALINHKNPKGPTEKEAIEKLDFIVNNFDVTKNKYFFQSFLSQACQFNKVDICVHILKNYPDKVNIEGQPFKCALESNATEVLTYLICDYKINQSQEVMNHLARSQLHMLYDAQQRNIKQYHHLMSLFDKRNLNNSLEEKMEEKETTNMRLKI